MSNGNMLGGVSHDKATTLGVSLSGVRASLEQILGTRCPLVFTDNDYRGVPNDKEIERYPYAYHKLSGLRFAKDRSVNVRSARRHGTDMTLDAITNSTIDKGYMFPFDFRTEVTIKHNNLEEIFRLVEVIGITGVTGAFSFKVSMPGLDEWSVRMSYDEDSLDIQQAQVNDPALPGTYTMTLSFNCWTKLGITKTVSKINNEGRITTGVNAKGDSI